MTDSQTPTRAARFPLSAVTVARVLRAAKPDPDLAAPVVQLAHARAFAEPFVVFAPAFDVVTRNRVGHLLAQCVVEGAWLRTTTEYASGWDYDPLRNPAKAKKLGNVRPGDGPRYRGHGRIQTTGRGNHRAVTAGLRALYPDGVPYGEGNTLDVPDFEARPLALTQEPWATLSAFMWWAQNGGNAEADRGDHVENVQRVSRDVNRGNYASPYKAYAEADRIGAFKTIMAALRREGL